MVIVNVILCILGLLAIGVISFIFGAVACLVGIGEIYKKNGKRNEYEEIIEFIQTHKKKED